MKTLIAEDDFTSRILLNEILRPFGPVHVAVNGKEAVEAVRVAADSGEPYDLVCLDIMMPVMDGYEALKEIRGLEQARGVNPPNLAKIFMITALNSAENVVQAVNGSCNYYLVKPIRKSKLLDQLYTLGLVG